MCNNYKVYFKSQTTCYYLPHTRMTYENDTVIKDEERTRLPFSTNQNLVPSFTLIYDLLSVC